MLKSLTLKNFTVFKGSDLKFAKGLNVVVGANGTGKTHLLKFAYVVMAVSAEEGKKRPCRRPRYYFSLGRIAKKISAFSGRKTVWAVLCTANEEAAVVKFKWTSYSLGHPCHSGFPRSRNPKSSSKAHFPSGMIDRRYSSPLEDC